MSFAPLKGWTERLSSFLHSAEVNSITKWAILSPTIGFLAGVAGVAFVWLKEFFIEHVFRRATGIVSDGIGSGNEAAPWLFLALPTFGGLLTGWLVQKFAPEAEGHGTDSVVHSYHRLRGVVRKRVIALKALTSAITIGSGGSAGQEGPVAQVGAGIGSSIATALKLSDRDRRVFLLSGASAGVGAVFCSPLGGALFMPEVLYRKPEFEGEGLIPCIISSIVGYTTFTAIHGAHRAVEIAPEELKALSFDRPTELLVYLALGVFCTLIGLGYVKVFYGVHALFAKLTAVPKFLRPAIGGFLLGALALALAGQTGEEGVFFGGYGLIQSAISGSLAVKTLLLLIAAKIVATSFTISSGGSGGVF
ncbi:MAG: chloride channel protein, partial [Planctomycetota bacterium]